MKENHIKKPSDKPYNFSVAEQDVATGGQYGQPWYLDAVIFKGKVQNGFFIEAGADDFVGGSNRFRILPKQWIIDCDTL